jgi:hypothetical protein
MHIDSRVAGKQPWDMAVREQLIRAQGAGWSRPGPDESYGAYLGHGVMLDPEGNEFCLA